MLSDVTPAVDRALQAAQTWARRLGALAVEPEHLLHGLLDEEEGRAAALLTQAGLDVSDVRRLAADRVAGATAADDNGPLPLSAEVRAILDDARRQAAAANADRTLTSDRVLVALLQGAALLCQELQGRGLSMAPIEEAARAAQGPPLRLEEPLRLAESAEEVDAARILDACANRAREALRVVEDYCRFVLDDALLSGEWKRLRHDLVEALEMLPGRLLLEARETLRDVGTELSTPREQTRHSLRAVVQANLKRLQEALRSLEEFGKLRGPDLGRAVEGLRYRSYTLERALVLGGTARERLKDARLYVLVTGSLCSASLEWTIQEAAAGGAQVVQLREKGLSDRALLERARQVRRWTRQARVLLIVNDRPDVARLAEADGVHLGQEELPVKEARRVLGPDAFIGISTHDMDQVRQAVLDGASYIGVGPTFPSGTKSFDQLAGLEFVRQATAETSLPAFVIGGVNLQTIDEAITAGARRVAVGQAICQADDPRQVAAELRRRLDEAAPSPPGKESR